MGKAEKQEKTNKKQKHFWKDFKAELKKVIWPTRSQVVNNTVVVVVIVLIVTAIVFALDLAFESLNTYGIDKLKVLVQDSVVSEDDENKNENDVNNDSNGETEGSGNTDEGTENNNEENNNNDETQNDNQEGEQTPDDTANIDNVSE